MSGPSNLHRDLPPLRKLLRLAGLGLRPRAARRLVTLATDGYLAETGWVESAARGEVVDQDGRPVPWATLPFIAFLAPRLRRTWTLFEYGAGASTLYYAERVARVVAVENDPGFAANLRPRLPQNVTLHVASAPSAEYVLAVHRCERRPELVSIDGRERVACVQAAIEHLAGDGVIVLDDAERGEYAGAPAALQQAGFRGIEFWGVAPGEVRTKCTAVFYRRDNVLAL